MSLAIRRELLRVCRSLYERGLIAGAEGNVSVRLSADRVLITPRGVPKGGLVDADLVVLPLSGGRSAVTSRASTEAAVHVRIYRARADVNAVVHAHPPVATGFAAAGLSLPQDVLPEVTVGLGPVGLVPYASPGTDALAERVEGMVLGHDVLLLSNHGALTVGPSIGVAHVLMESLEHAARILLVARLVGGPVHLERADVEALLALRTPISPGPQSRTSGRRWQREE